MTIRELREVLNKYDDENNVYVFDWTTRRFTFVQSSCTNNGELQLNITSEECNEDD